MRTLSCRGAARAEGVEDAAEELSQAPKFSQQVSLGVARFEGPENLP